MHRVVRGADDSVAAASSYNPPAHPGFEYILVDVTVRSLRPAGAAEAQMISFGFVTSRGVPLDSSARIAVAPDQLDLFASAYTGGVATGNVALHVPRIDAHRGQIAVHGLSDAAVLIAIGGLACESEG